MSKRAISKYLPWIACVALAMISGPASAVCYRAPAAEVLLLPKLCWAQYCVRGAQGPQYRFPPGCGYSMNHYCPALISLQQGMTSSGGTRLQDLQVAKEGILYTLNHIKRRHPGCVIRAQVESSLTEVNTFLGLPPGR